MTEFWQSNPRKWCDFCKCWLTDNKPSVDFHENGNRHKEAVRLRLKESRRKTVEDNLEKKQTEDILAQIERDALKAMESDLANDPTLRARDTSYRQQVAQKPAPTSNASHYLAMAQRTSASSGISRDGSVIVPTPPAPPPSKQDPWVEVTMTDGNVYYYNSVTQESVWTKPATEQTISDAPLQEQKEGPKEKTLDSTCDDKVDDKEIEDKGNDTKIEEKKDEKQPEEQGDSKKEEKEKPDKDAENTKDNDDDSKGTTENPMADKKIEEKQDDKEGDTQDDKLPEKVEKAPAAVAFKVKTKQVRNKEGVVGAWSVVIKSTVDSLGQMVPEEPDEPEEPVEPPVVEDLTPEEARSKFLQTLKEGGDEPRVNFQQKKVMPTMKRRGPADAEGTAVIIKKKKRNQNVKKREQIY
eukprot:m.56478 g.56478  ORF g.56478 m.56478 type:complete len:410 (-) comp22254_c0_seq1:348-1577(-)